MKVSVLIVTLDAGAGLERLLQAVSAQEGSFEREIVVVDSGSVDGSDELARRRDATVHRIAKSAFDHGATRNLGVSLTRGEYVALIVQDAVPVDGRWLATMVEELDRDERVAGVYGRQLPHPESGVLVRSVVNGLATAEAERREQRMVSWDEYRALAPGRRRRLAAFDNVSSCLRRSVWEQIPFERTGYGEDIRWGKRVVEAGYKLVYAPGSAVWHSHERGVAFTLRRHYVDQRLMAELFGSRSVPDLRHLILAVPRSFVHRYWLLCRDGAPVRERAGFLSLVAGHAAATEVGAYLACKSDRIAELSPRAFRRLDAFLTRGI